MKKLTTFMLIFILSVGVFIPAFASEDNDKSVENHTHKSLMIEIPTQLVYDEHINRYPAHICHNGPQHEYCYEKEMNTDSCGCKFYEVRCCCDLTMTVRLKFCNTPNCVNK